MAAKNNAVRIPRPSRIPWAMLAAVVAAIGGWSLISYLIPRSNLYLPSPAAVDAQTRITLQEELNRIAIATRKTILFITHNVEEAAFLGDRCCILTRRPGRLKRVVDIPIPRERRVWKTLTTDPEFTARREQVLTLVREEVRGSEE